MAAFKGFQFTSASDLQLAMQQQFEKAASSGNLDTNRLAVARQAANTLAPPEAVRKAAKTEDILKEAFRSAESDSSGDEIDKHMRFLENAQRAAVMAGLPEIAIQATEQLSTARLGQEERSRLKSAEMRAQAQEKRDQSAEMRAQGVYESEMERNELAYRMARQKVLVDGQNRPIMNVDIASQEDLDKLSQEMKENPDYRLIDNDKLFDFTSDMLLQQQRLEAQRQERLKDAKGIPATTLNRFYDTASGQMTFAHSLDTMVDLISKDPDAFTSARNIQGFVNNMETQGRAMARAVGLEAAYDRRINDKLDSAGITVGARRSAVMDLAYALATSREGGRLTDQDIDRAIETLGFLDNADPRVIVNVLRERVADARESWASRGEVAGLRYSEETAATWQAVEDVYSNTSSKLDALWEKIADDSPGSASPGTEAAIEAAPEPATSTLTTKGLDSGTRSLLFDTVQ